MEFRIKSLNVFSIIRQTLAITVLALLPTLATAQDYDVSVGDDFGAVIDNNGNLFVWGALGDGGGELTQILPSEVWESVAVSKTAAAEAHVLAIRTDGTLWAFGANDRGQLGNGTQTASAEPVQIGSANNWAQVAVGEDFSLGLRDDGLLFAWGDNTYGQLGFGPPTNNPDQDLVTQPGFPFSGTYSAISAGNAHAHAIDTDGALWAWGSGGSATNGGYELGTGKLEVGPVLPTQIGTLDGWTALFSGYSVTYATRDTATEVGQLWVWGSGGFLGRGDIGNAIQASPARVGNGVGWSSVSRSRTHTLALKVDGSLWGWGENYNDGELGLPVFNNTGQLNDGSGGRPDNRYKVSPTPLEAPNTFLAVGAGESFSVIIKADGFMLSAGRNDLGQLANGLIDSTPADGQDFFDNSNLGIADLVATAVTFTTETPAPGATISGSLSLFNGGTGAITEDFELAVVFSASTNFVGGTPLTFDGGLATVTVSDDIAAGASLSVPILVEIPANVPQGEFFIVVKADAGGVQPDGVVTETSETNNSAATAASYEFFPDLIFDDPDGIEMDSVGPYEPGDPFETTINLENSGAGTIPSGTVFDIRVFLTPTQDANNAGAVDLNSELEVVLAADLVPGGTLAIDFDVPLPAGLASGSYYIGGVVDVNEEVSEQTELLSDTNVVLRADGEANNVYFTDTALVTIIGIPIDEAIDELGRVFTTSGDANWFGQDQVFNVGGHSVQSPSIGVGDTAAFNTTFTDPVVITFDWRSATSSAQNKLTYRVIGGVTGTGQNEISGNTGWLSEQRVVSAGAQVEWEYSEGVDAAGDAVYVDNLEVFVVTDPELIVDAVNLTKDGSIVDSGTYVLKRDQLNVNINSRNQGTATGPLDDFVVSLYLSADRDLDRPDGDPGTLDDILLRQVTIDDVFGAGSFAVNGLSIDLPTNIPEGNYYLIAYIDDYTDENGDPLPGTTPGTGSVDEYTTGGFPGETNNLFVTSDPVVEIVALADLVVTEVNPVPGYYLVRELNTDTGLLEPNVLDFDFTIANEGLAPVNESIRIKVLLSRDEVMDPNSDYVVLDYEYNGGLAAVGSSASTALIDPGAVDIRDDLVSLGYIGERLYFGVFIDSGSAVEELDETNNGINYIDNDFIFSEVTVAQALEFDTGAGNVVVQDTTPAFDGELPWVGQSEVTIDGVDAAMSLEIGDNEVSAFETLIDAGSSPTFVTFRWRVSSQDDEVGRDALNFYIDDMSNPVASTSGTEAGWVRVSRLVGAGEHRLRWEYAKDAIVSAGLDRGWVDSFSFQVPNLVVEEITIDDSIGYTAGDSIGTWSVTIRNTGLADVPATPPFDIQLRISSNNTWGSGSEYIVLTITDNERLAIGESRTYSQLTDGDLIVPAEIALDDDYYVGAFVDWNEDEPTTGSIPESDDTDNDLFTVTNSLSITPSVLLNVAIDDEPATLELEVGGAGGWFGVVDAQIPGGASDGVDAAQSGATGIGESSYLQTLVEGPFVLEFDWKVSSRAGSNFLEFSINGVVQESISGEVDWETQEIFIPAGTQELRWTYRKTGDAGAFADAGWLDQVVFTPFGEPELALTALTYTAGRYVLDVAGIAGAPNQLLGTEYLDITVEAENQGADLSDPDNFTVADLEVRLSTDRTYGNADDIVLGTVSQVEGTLEAGDLMRFLGPIQLGDSIPAGFYYLIARVDANDEITEFDEENNIMISAAKDVEIARLPALRIANPMDDSASTGPTTEIVDGVNFYLDPLDGADVAFDLDENLIYYTEAPIRLRFDIHNVGLGRVEGSQIWTTEVNLRGIKREDIAGLTDSGDFVSAVDPSINLGSFTVQELLEGRSATKPEGDSVEIDLDLALPGGARLNDIIDEDLTIVDYLWFIEVIIDSTNVIEESEIVRESPALIAPTGLPWWIVDLNEVVASTHVLDPGTYPNPIEDPAFSTDVNDGFFGISFQSFGPTDAADWETLYPGYPTAVDENLLAYAFNRNPADGDTAGNQFPGTFGVTAFEGEQYLSIAFDIVTRATDLVYTVEADDDAGFPSPDTLVVIDGPFDTLTGPTSLTGDGGLGEEANVTSVLDQGYSARVTVKDLQDVTASPMRFIRVVVNAADTEPVPE